MDTRSVAAGVLVVATMTLVAGCGDEGTDANTPEVRAESYANIVCSQAVDWSAVSTEIEGYQAGTATYDDVVRAQTPAQDGTENFILNIRGMPQPDDATQKATYTSLQETADTLSNRWLAIASDIDNLKLKTSPPHAQAQIELLYGDLKTSVAHLDKLYPDAGVAADVDSRANCAPLQA
jgi:hypothetical protein